MSNNNDKQSAIQPQVDNNERSTIQIQFDEVLKQYYKYCNRQYNNEFSKFVKENGIEDDSIEEELEDEGMLVDVDPDFPLIEGDKEKNMQKLLILRRIFNGSDFYAILSEFGPVIEVNNKRWNDAIENYHQFANQYEKMFPTLSKEMKGDVGFKQILAIGEQQSYPYFQFLMDMSQQNRIKNKEVIAQNMVEWAENNNHMQQLKKIKCNDNSVIPFEVTKSALDNCKRMGRPIVSPVYLIIDSLEDTAEYICSMIEFIYALVNNEKKKTCPFQYDCCIAFENVKQLITNEKVNNIPDNNQNGDDDDDNKESKQNEVNQKDIDYFGDITKKLKNNNLFHKQHFYVNPGALDAGNNIVKPFLAHRLFGEYFKDEIVKKKKKFHNKEMWEYPRNQRFCAVIDKRRKNKQTQDSLIIFEPPNDCNTIEDPEKDTQSLSYFNNLKTCIIPNDDYKHNDKDDKEIDDDIKKNIDKRPITSDIGCNGKLMILSFHALSTSTIRCYLYINGGMIRFYPEYLRKLLPIYFDPEYGSNKSFDATEYIKRIKDMLPDPQFKQFLKKNK